MRCRQALGVNREVGYKL